LEAARRRVPQYARIVQQAGLFVRTALWFERPTRLEGSTPWWLDYTRLRVVATKP